MLSYIAHGGGPEQGVAEGMQGHIGVAVTQESALVGYLNATYYTLAPLGEAVHVKAVSDSW